MKVAAIQFTSGASLTENRAAIEGHLESAAGEGAALVVLPEASQRAFGGPGEPLAVGAEALDGPFVNALERAAERLDLVVVAGMFEVAEGDRPYNTTVVVGPDGLRGAYRKVHLYDALRFEESAGLRAGPVEPDNIVVVDVGGWQVGVQTCFDIRFPEASRALVDKGAEVLVLGAAWVAGPHKVHQLDRLCAARAIESTSYLVVACQSGDRYCGRSHVVDPLGETIGEVGPASSAALAVLSRDVLETTRRDMPVLGARRLGS